MKPLYIFDIDGTIANCKHRIHHIIDLNPIPGVKFLPNWPAFDAEIGRDFPIHNNIHTLHQLMKTSDIWFFTGRMDRGPSRESTLHWLRTYTSIKEPNLTMRPHNDYRDDFIIKQEMLDNILEVDRNRLVAVFDDRDRVVKMWRENDITCYQVCYGDY